MSAPKLDGYGLHATDCACPRCEAGYRPTATQRSNARLWALQRGQQAAAQRRAVEREEKHRAEVARTSELIRTMKPVRLTPEQLAELAEIRERMFPHG